MAMRAAEQQKRDPRILQGVPCKKTPALRRE